jgi:hypothetical protein
VTRIFAECTRQAALANPNTTRLRWQTGRDELVCPQCGPLDGVTVEKERTFAGNLFPPAHPNCRCAVSAEAEMTGQVPAGTGGAGAWNSA